MALTSPGVIKAANDILVQIAPELTMVKQFVYDCSDAVEDFGAKVRVPVANGISEDFDIDSKDYEHKSGYLSDVFVTLDKQPKVTFEVTGKDALELGNAPIWNRLAESGRRAISNAVQSKVGALITTSLTKVTSVTITGNEDAGDLLPKLAKLREDCYGNVGDTVLALDPVIFAKALGELDSAIYGGTEAVRTGVIPQLYGFKAVVSLKMGSGVKAALIPTDAIAVAVRAVAVGDEGCYSEYGTVADENGFPVTVMRHGSAAKGKGFINVTTLIGAELVKYQTAEPTVDEEGTVTDDGKVSPIKYIAAS